MLKSRMIVFIGVLFAIAGTALPFQNCVGLKGETPKSATTVESKSSAISPSVSPPSLEYMQNGSVGTVRLTRSGNVTVNHQWRAANTSHVRISYRLFSGSCEGKSADAAAWRELTSSSEQTGGLSAEFEASRWNGCVFQFLAEATGPGGSATSTLLQCWGDACGEDLTPAPTVTYRQNGAESFLKLEQTGTAVIRHDWSSTNADRVVLSYRWLRGECEMRSQVNASWSALSWLSGTSGSHSVEVDSSRWKGCVFEFKIEAIRDEEITQAFFIQDWADPGTSTPPAPVISYTQNGMRDSLKLAPSGAVTLRHDWSVSHATQAALSYRLFSGSCTGNRGSDVGWHALGFMSSVSGTHTGQADASQWDGCTFEFKIEASGTGGTREARFFQCWGTQCSNVAQPTLVYLQNGESGTMRFAQSTGSVSITHQWSATAAESVRLSYRYVSGQCRGHTSGDNGWHELSFVNSAAGSHTTVSDAADWVGCIFEFKLEAAKAGTTESRTVVQIWSAG